MQKVAFWISIENFSFSRRLPVFAAEKLRKLHNGRKPLKILRPFILSNLDKYGIYC